MSIVDINTIQDEIIEEFSILGDDYESTIFYIMDLGKRLAGVDETYRQDQYLIKGCQSKVWLHANLSGDRIIFQADSNTEITKGLISLLIRVLNNRTTDEIIHADLYFIDKIGMQKVIGSQRSNGLASMIKQMKLYALAYKTKIENQS